LDEASYLRYEHFAEDGAAMANRGLTFPVKLKLIDESTFSHEGRMDFVDNAIDRSSGTIVRARSSLTRMEGSRPACSRGFGWRLHLPRTQLLVPDAAIGVEQVRKFVLVVDAKNVARRSTCRLDLSSMVCASSPRGWRRTTTSLSTA